MSEKNVVKSSTGGNETLENDAVETSTSGSGASLPSSGGKKNIAEEKKVGNETLENDAVESLTGDSGVSLPSSGGKKNNNETLKKDKVKSSTGVSSSSLASSEATENNVDAIEKEADDNEKSLNDLFKKGKAKRSLRIAKAPKKNVSKAKVIVKKLKDNKKSKFASGVSSASSRSLRSSGRGKKPKEPEKKSKRNVQSSSASSRCRKRSSSASSVSSRTLRRQKRGNKNNDVHKKSQLNVNSPTASKKRSASGHSHLPRRKKVRRSHSPMKNKKEKVMSQKDLELNELNKDPDAHRQSFDNCIKEICLTENKKLTPEKCPRLCQYFTTLRYKKYVEYHKLCQQVEEIDPSSGAYYNAKEQLNAHMGNKKWKNFQLRGGKLMRPTIDAISRGGGNMNDMDFDLLVETDWEEVVCIDDGKLFDRIKKHHWHSNPKKHIRSNQLHKCVSREFGLNFTNAICLHFIRSCKVCKKLNEDKKLKQQRTGTVSAVNALSVVRSAGSTPSFDNVGDVVFTVIDIRESVSNVHFSKTSLDHPYLLVCLFLKNRYFEVGLLVSNKASEIRSRFVCWFNTIGFPSSIRYYPDKQHPVDVVGQNYVFGIDEVCSSCS